jgi:putative acetyltransferase
MLIRREVAADRSAVRAVVGAAFAADSNAQDEPIEVRLLDALRASPAWIPELSLVAEDMDGAVVGHVVCTRASVADRPVVALGPLAVAPARQRLGAGSALMHAVVGASDALGEPLVGLLGHLDYYPRFGFVPAEELGIHPPVAEWGAHFQVRTLSAYDTGLRGSFRYAKPFEDL